LVTCRDGATPLRERERRLLAAAGSQLGVAVEGADLFADLREMTKAKNRLLRSLVDAQEQERRSLVGDLHDGLGQALTRVLYGLRGSRSRLAGSESEVSRELERLESLVEEQSRNLRRFLAAARPAVLEDFGLARALESFAREQETDSGPPIRVHLTPVPQLAGAAEIVLFRAAQEAVINARKHAAARHVWIEMEPDDGAIVLEVGDDGRGTSEIRDGIGLTSMKDRVASLGGHVDIQSRPGEGTVVSIRIPLEEQHERH
jgi:signal transduction histidine kinase